MSPEVLATLGQYPELGKKAAVTFPKAPQVELPGVGHIPHFEAPERRHQALPRFLGK